MIRSVLVFVTSLTGRGLLTVRQCLSQLGITTSAGFWIQRDSAAVALIALAKWLSQKPENGASASHVACSLIAADFRLRDS